MRQYEILVLRDDGATALIVASLHLNNNSAIRPARKIARAHEFEVWRGVDCIYRTREFKIANTSPPDLPAA